jgi:ATP-dependent DNA ligase
VFELADVARDRDGPLRLVVGVRYGRELRYPGTVSFGVTRRVVSELHPIIEPLVRTAPPFLECVRWMDAVWVEPRVRVELTYAEIIGGVLRDPVLRGVLR